MCKVYLRIRDAVAKRTQREFVVVRLGTVLHQSPRTLFFVVCDFTSTRHLSWEKAYINVLRKPTQHAHRRSLISTQTANWELLS